MWCAADNHNYMCRIYAKGFLDSNFNQAIIDKILNFHKISPNFTFRLTASTPINFYSRDMQGMFFFIFASCDPLTVHSYYHTHGKLIFN